MYASRSTTIYLTLLACAFLISVLALGNRYLLHERFEYFYSDEEIPDRFQVQSYLR